MHIYRSFYNIAVMASSIEYEQSYLFLNDYLRLSNLFRNKYWSPKERKAMVDYFHVSPSTIERYCRIGSTQSNIVPYNFSIGYRLDLLPKFNYPTQIRIIGAMLLNNSIKRQARTYGPLKTFERYAKTFGEASEIAWQCLTHQDEEFRNGLIFTEISLESAMDGWYVYITIAGISIPDGDYRVLVKTYDEDGEEEYLDREIPEYA